MISSTFRYYIFRYHNFRVSSILLKTIYAVYRQSVVDPVRKRSKYNMALVRRYERPIIGVLVYIF